MYSPTFPRSSFELDESSRQAVGLFSWWPSLGSREGNTLQERAERGSDAGAFNGGMAWTQNTELGPVPKYDGSSGYISVPDNARLDLGPNHFIISFWVWKDAADTRKFILNKRVDGDNFWAVEWQADNTIFFQAFTGGVERINILSATALSANTLYHVTIACKRDSTAETRISVNGVDNTFGTPTVAANNISQAASLDIGRWSGGGFYFDGQISDLRISLNQLAPDQFAWQLWNPETRWDLYLPVQRVWAVKVPVAAGQTIAVNQVTETDAAQSMAWAPKNRLAAQVVETNLPQAISSVKLKQIAQVLESDVSQSVSSAKARAISQVTEADLAQAIARVKTLLLGSVLETDLAQAMAWAPKNRLAGQVVETDLSQGISSAKLKQVAQVLESDVSQSVSSAKARAISQVTETDFAQAIARVKTLLLSAVLETDVAQAVAWAPKNRLIGQTTEVDLAQAAASLKSKSINQVIESDLAQVMAWAPKHRLVGQVTETDLVQVITVVGVKIIVVGQVIETDLAQSILWAPKNRLVAQATETELAQAIATAKLKVIAQTIEADAAQMISWAPKNRLVAQISESDLAQVITWAPKHRLVGQVSETDLAQGITVVILITAIGVTMTFVFKSRDMDFGGFKSRSVDFASFFKKRGTTFTLKGGG